MTRTLLIVLGASMMALGSGTAVAANPSNDNAFNAMDTNGDNMVSQSEFSAYRSHSYDWVDRNRDNRVSRSEFDSYYADSDYFSNWDADHNGTIDEDEFGEGLYGTWDADDDDYISDDEWIENVWIDDDDEIAFHDD